MKQLETQFVSGEGGFSATPLTYTQVVRNEKFAVYERSLDGKVKDYETIKIKLLKAGTRIFQQVLTEDEERYPGTSEFGRSAWSFSGNGKDAAMNKFNKLTEDQNEDSESKEVVEDKGFKALVTKKLTQEPKIRGRKRKERPTIVYPVVEQWLMKDLLTLNPQWSQPLAYIQLKKDMGMGKVKEVARIKSQSGRGRAAVAYRTV
mgnify:CR=1 FL=1